VKNKITRLEVRDMTPEEEDMEDVEDTKVEEDSEAKEGVEEHLAEDEDRSSIITGDNRVTSHETVRRLLVTIVNLPIMLLKNA
jgi:hypothetical protein